MFLRGSVLRLVSNRKFNGCRKVSQSLLQNVLKNETTLEQFKLVKIMQFKACCTFKICQFLSYWYNGISNTFEEILKSNYGRFLIFFLFFWLAKTAFFIKSSSSKL